METQNSRDFILEPPQIQLPEPSGAHFDVKFCMTFFSYKHLKFLCQGGRGETFAIQCRTRVKISASDGEVDIYIDLPDSAQEIQVMN